MQQAPLFNQPQRKHKMNNREYYMEQDVKVTVSKGRDIFTEKFKTIAGATHWLREMQLMGWNVDCIDQDGKHVFSDLNGWPIGGE